MAKKPRTSGKPTKRGALVMGTPGEPPKAEAKGLGPPPPTQTQAEAVAQLTHFTIDQVQPPPFNAAPFNNPPLNDAVHSTTGPVEPPFVPSAAHGPALTTIVSPPIPVTAGSVAVVEGRLSREPEAIRDLARNLSQEFASQAEDLKRSRPNDERLAQHDDLIAFFERMADGLAQLADALDEAVKGAGNSPDSVSIGKAAQIARSLHEGVMRWLEQNFTSSFDCAVRIGLFGVGITFLHSIGADYVAAVGALGTLALKGGQAKDRKSKKTSKKS
jgi:hypothetical protein